MGVHHTVWQCTGHAQGVAGVVLQAGQHSTQHIEWDVDARGMTGCDIPHPSSPAPELPSTCGTLGVPLRVGFGSFEVVKVDSAAPQESSEAAASLSTCRLWQEGAFVMHTAQRRRISHQQRAACHTPSGIGSGCEKEACGTCSALVEVGDSHQRVIGAPRFASVGSWCQRNNLCCTLFPTLVMCRKAASAGPCFCGHPALLYCLLPRPGVAAGQYTQHCTL